MYTDVLKLYNILLLIKYSLNTKQIAIIRAEIIGKKTSKYVLYCFMAKTIHVCTIHCMF